MPARFSSSLARVAMGWIVLAGLVACSSDAASRDATSGDTASSATTAAVSPVSVSPAQFEMLRWLGGRWRGADAGGVPFYESYELRSSGVIASYAYRDSTFALPSDSGKLELRGDTLFSGSPAMQWVATRFDSARVEFAPWRGAANHFVWQRGTGRNWTATLQWDSAGVRKERVYEMRPIE